MGNAISLEPLGHWHKLFENFETSPMDFYEALEKAVQYRQIPDAFLSLVEWRESGAGSSSREYLRVSRGRYVFDVCAAPFGTGFFFSWWFARSRPSAVPGTVAAIFVFLVLFWYFAWWLSILLWLVIFAVLGAVLSQSESEMAGYIAAIPLLGAVWESIFLPATYYRLDTQAMFRGAVQAAVLEVVDSLTDSKGLQRLGPDERKPVMREFFRK